MQPFGDRSKVVIEPMLTDQWFVDTAKIVGPALDAVRDGRTKIIPESGEKTYFHWLENIEPWCISRQLWWGHQIPVWYGPMRPMRNRAGSIANITSLCYAPAIERFLRSQARQGRSASWQSYYCEDRYSEVSPDDFGQLEANRHRD